MSVNETKLRGAFIIKPKLFEDERGFFTTSWALKDFASDEFSRAVQCNVSLSRKKGTLRGMHFQSPPHAQAKVVRCTRGSIYDVIIDLRPESPTFRQWVGVELSASNLHTIFVPAGFAHGFQTLEDETEIYYLVSEYYAPQSELGVRWDDPAFGIEWPHADERTINARDREYPDFAF